MTSKQAEEIIDAVIAYGGHKLALGSGVSHGLDSGALGRVIQLLGEHLDES